MTANPTPSTRATRLRKVALVIALWFFGISTTTLLAGVWGRSVSGDEATLTASARAAFETEAVADRVFEWLADGLTSVSGLSGPEYDAALHQVAESPEATAAMEEIIGSVVAAAVAPPGTVISIDVPGAIEQLRPVMDDALAAQGIELPAAQVDGVLRRLEGVVVATEQEVGMPGIASRARTVLTRVLFVGLGALLLFGSAAIRLSDDRIRMARSLANRLAVSAFTFMVFLRVGKWAVDPNGGRSPLAKGGAVILGSNSLVLAMIGAAAVAAGLIASIFVRGRRLRLPVGSAEADATVEPVTDPDVTGEREPVLVRV